jgi:Skp1 family, dimerisation domain
MIAADFTGIPKLFELVAAQVACMINIRTPEEIVELFHIPHELTFEHDPEKIIAANPWYDFYKGIKKPDAASAATATAGGGEAKADA